MRTRTYDFGAGPPDPVPPAEEQAQGPGPLALVLLLSGSAALLYRLGGPPHLPARPDPDAIVHALTLARPPLEGAASWCFAAGWGLWLWTAASFLAQAMLAFLDTATRRAAWVRTLRPTITPFLMPLARRAFPVLAIGALFARLGTSPSPAVAATPIPLTLTLGLTSPSDLGSTPVGLLADTQSPLSVAREHVVTEGDSLRSLALRYFGTEDEFARLHEANLDRPMPDGTRYAGRLRPGQVLQVPPVSLALVRTGGQIVYVVEGGDTLRGIAARFLGDEMRWPEIFALNRGTSSMLDGRTLNDPDLIWPGLELILPVEESAPPPPAPAPPTSLPSAPASPLPSPSPAVLPSPSSSPTPTPSSSASPSPIPISSAMPAITAASAVPTATSARSSASPTTSARPSASAVAAYPTAYPTVGPPAEPSPGRAPLLVGAGALGLALLGGTTFLSRRRLLARRELRRRLRGGASTVATNREGTDDRRGFADVDPAETFAHRAYGGEIEPAVAVAHHAARLVGEHGLVGAAPLLAVQGRHGDATLLLKAPLAERDDLIAIAPLLGALLGGKGHGRAVRVSGDVEFHLTALTAAGLLAPLPTRPEHTVPTMLPLVELPGGEPLFASWDVLGHLLVASGPGEGADTVLTGIVAVVASRRHPDTLRLWSIAHSRTLPPELFRLPHWGDPRVDPSDTARVAELLGELRVELDRRRAEPPSTPRPDLVLVLGELAALAGLMEDATIGTALELLAADGPAYGIRLLAATARPETLDEAFLHHFATRLVLPMSDESWSIRLLGVPDAIRLNGGHVLLRLAGRPPRGFAGVAADRLRGYRIAPEILRGLADQMCRAYSRPAAAGPSEELLDRDPGRAGRQEEGLASSENCPGVPSSGAAGAELPVSEEPVDTTPIGLHVLDSARPSQRLVPNPAGENPPHRVRDRKTRLASRKLMPSAVKLHRREARGDGTPPRGIASVDRRGEPEDSSPLRAGRNEDASGSSALFGDASEKTGACDEISEHRAPAPDLDEAAATEAQHAITDAVLPQRDVPALSNLPKLPEPLTADALRQELIEAPAITTPLDIRCFGMLQVRHAGRSLAPQRHLKAWELLQLLAVRPPRSLTKGKLAIALWPDPDNSLSRNTVNVAVLRLREELTTQVPGLSRAVVRQTRSGACWLDPDLVTSDVHVWLAIIEQEPKQPLTVALTDYRRAAQLFRPTVLDGASFEWLSSVEEGVDLSAEYRDTWRRYLLRLARRCVRENRPDLAVPLFRRCVEDQPRDEAVVRELYRCYGQVGDLRGLEREALSLAQCVRRGYGDEQDKASPRILDEPEEETQKVYREVHQTLIEELKARRGPQDGGLLGRGDQHQAGL